MNATLQPQTNCVDAVTENNGEGKCSANSSLRIKWRATFIRWFRKHGNASEAANYAGVDRSTVAKARKRSKKFNDAYVRAKQDSRRSKIDIAEKEMFHRAVYGRTEPVYQGGTLVGHKRKRSDALLVKVLEAESPRKYSRKTESHVRVDAVVVSTDVRNALLSNPEVADLACKLAAAVCSSPSRGALASPAHTQSSAVQDVTAIEQGQ